MKKQIILFLFLVLASLSKAEIEVLSVDRYSPSNGTEYVTFEMPIARSLILNAEDKERIGNAEIKEVHYVYSSYAPKNYNQDALNTERMRRIRELIPELNSLDIKWKVIAQTDCDSHASASKLLHGFIVYYAPKGLFTIDQLEVQAQRIQSENQSVVTGKHGLKVTIPSNAFVDANGNAVEGEVDICLREAIESLDILKAGLDTRTDKGEILESDGMFELRAKQGGRELSLARGKSLTVELPGKGMEDMSFYSGKEVNGKIVWVDPVPLNQPIVMDEEDVREETSQDIAVVEIDPLSSIEFWGIHVETDHKNDIGNVISSLSWDWNRRSGDMDLVWVRVNDERIAIDDQGYSVDLGVEYGLDRAQATRIKSWFDNDQRTSIDEINAFFGFDAVALMMKQSRNMRPTQMQLVWRQNTGLQNDAMTYVLNMKKLGWGNIDRLAKFTRTKPIALYIAPKGVEDSVRVDMVLVVDGMSIYLPAYKCKSGNYSFTHGDYEKKAQMPIGRRAKVLAMAFDGNQHYFGIQKIRFGERELEELNLEPVTLSQAEARFKSHL